MKSPFTKNLAAIFGLIITLTTIAFADAEFKASTFSKSGEVVLIKWNSVEGRNRLDSTKYKEDFYQLAHNFQPQINPLYCGIASSVIVLNSLYSDKLNIPSKKDLELSLPIEMGSKSIPFHSFSQITFLNKDTNRIKHRDVIHFKKPASIENGIKKWDPGLSLKQLAGMLELYGLKIQIFHATTTSTKDIDDFRSLLKKIFSDTTIFIIANFKGKTIGAKTGGHISPLAAYHENSDSLLILDVAGHKHAWHWAPLTHFYKSMNTLDGKKHRGWLLIERQKP